VLTRRSAPTHHINEALQNVEPPKAFYHFVEEDALRLIAICAQALVHVDPYQDHPANKDLPDRGQGGTRKRASQCGPPTPAKLDLDRNVSLGRLNRKTKTHAPNACINNTHDHGRSGSRDDLEEIFSRFSPRLREIVEEQTAECRANAKSRSKAAYADVAGPAVPETIGQGALAAL